MGEGRISDAQNPRQMHGGEDLLSGRSRVSIRSAVGPNLRIEGPHTDRFDLWTATEHQCDQCGKCARRILGGYLYWQAQCGSVCCLSAEFHEESEGEDI